MKEIKSLSKIFFTNKLFKPILEEKKKRSFLFNLNFDSNLKFLKKSHDKTKKKLMNKRLIILGLNWKYIKAVDIYSFLKPFENQPGSLERVSIVSCDEFLVGGNKLPNTGSNFISYLNSTNISLTRFDKNIKIFSLIDCNSIKTMKDLYKKCNGIEIGEENKIIDMRIVKLDLLEKIHTIESVNKIARNYYPQFLKSNFLKKKEIESKIKESKNIIKKSNNNDLREKKKTFKTKFWKKINKNQKFSYSRIWSSIVKKEPTINKINGFRFGTKVVYKKVRGKEKYNCFGN